MLDFDYVCSRTTPSVVAMVYPFRWVRALVHAEAFLCHSFRLAIVPLGLKSAIHFRSSMCNTCFCLFPLVVGLPSNAWWKAEKRLFNITLLDPIPDLILKYWYQLWFVKCFSGYHNQKFYFGHKEIMIPGNIPYAMLALFHSRPLI